MNSTVDRVKIADAIVRASRNADLKQHADKLIQGFSRIDANSHNRAIWELVQNACDLTPACEVVLDYRNDTFTFTHNGKAFTPDTLISLIKQVSSKGEENEVGRFGTGFITTHAFGRKFLLNSLLEIEGKFIRISNFEIDRSPKDAADMIDRLIAQELEAINIAKYGADSDGNDLLTEFCYIPTTAIEKEAVKLSSKLLGEYVPLVMTFNERLKKVTIIDQQEKISVYSKVGKRNIDGKFITDVLINGVLQEIHSLWNRDNGIEIVLPIAKGNQAFHFSKEVARLFLFYPLIGTEHFGLNYIIHASSFVPTEPRDGIHLRSRNEQVADAERINREILSHASNLIFEYLKEYGPSIDNTVALATADFVTNGEKPFLNEYYKQLKQEWVHTLKQIDLVQTMNGKKKPTEVVFFQDDLIQNDEILPSLFTVCTQLQIPLPALNFVKSWARVVQGWEDNSVDIIGIDKITDKIHAVGKLDEFEPSSLQAFYNYIIAQERGALFTQKKLLPNLLGSFHYMSQLRQLENINSDLIQIGKILMPDVVKSFIQDEFIFDRVLDKYKRSNFASDLNDRVVRRIHDKIRAQLLEPEYITALLRYCLISATKDSESIPLQVMKLVSRFFGEKEDELLLPAIKDDLLDIRTPQKRILRLMMNEMTSRTSSWVIENIDFIKLFLGTVGGYSDYEDLLLTIPVYPNQIGEFRTALSLMIDDGIPDEVLDMYDKVIKANLPIRATLIHQGLADLLPNGKKLTIRNVTDKIEDVFSNDGQYTDINDHPFQKEILDIIRRISSDEIWSQYFPRLAGRRANIMLDRVTDEHIKSDVFSIVSLDSGKINKLGELARKPEMDLIIQLGEAALQDIKQKEHDFEFKHMLGKYIEDLLREELSDRLKYHVEVKISDDQNGQDLVISVNGQAVYYIEVKSKWREDTPIRMSRNQSIKANTNADKYALCTVDLSSFSTEEKDSVMTIQQLSKYTWFSDDIGERLNHLVPIYQMDGVENSFRLDGDYRTYVPISYVHNGKSLNVFETELINRIGLKK